MTVRRRAAVLAATALLAATAGCTGSSRPATRTSASDADVCSWPAGASAGALVQAGTTLYSFDSASGRRLGSCAGGGLLQGQPALEVDGQSFATEAPQYARPPVAGADLRVMPDNRTPGDQSSTRGGVRELRTGKHRALPFGGWLVVTAIGARLLLEKFHPEDMRIGLESNDPADWCVLPSVSAPLARCAPVTTSATTGSPAVAPDGTISWIPVAGRPLAIGGLHGYAATDGAALTAYAPAAPAVKSVEQWPVGMDEHTVVFPAGGVFSPTSRRTLQWATVTAAGVRLHDAGITESQAESSEPEIVEPRGGVQGSPDGSALALFGGSSRKVLVVTRSGHVTAVPLQLPAGSNPWLIRWPFGTGTAAQP